MKSSDAKEGTSADDFCQATKDLKVDDNGNKYIKQHEGFVKTVYDDGNGFPTVGYGHKVVPTDDLKLRDTITDERADTFFGTDLPPMEKAVRNAAGTTDLSQNEFNALTDLAFNVGPGVFTTDKSPSLMKALKAGDYKSMSEQLRYTGKDPDTKEGLINRSNDRKSLFLGTYEHKNK